MWTVLDYVARTYIQYKAFLVTTAACFLLVSMRWVKVSATYINKFQQYLANPNADHSEYQ